MYLKTIATSNLWRIRLTGEQGIQVSKIFQIRVSFFLTED